MIVHDLVVDTLGPDEHCHPETIELIEEPGICARIARSHRLTIGDLYRERVGIWSPALNDYRNEVLVRSRALFTGQDPDAEYARFAASKAPFYLNSPFRSDAGQPSNVQFD